MSELMYQMYSPSGWRKNKRISNSSRLVLEEAEKYGVEWEIIPGTQIVTLTHDGVSQSFYHQVPASTTALARYICNNKKVASNLFQQAGISVPRGLRIKRDASEEYLREVFEYLKKPLVVKPSSGSWGDNITLSITDYERYVTAIDYAFSYSAKKNSTVIVEEMFEGTEYRVLLTRDKVLGVLYRRPASVLGNGENTIKQLIQEKNKESIRGPKNSTMSHLRIRIDDSLKQFLAEQELDLESIPVKGKRVFLREVSNISRGGDAIDFTDKVHPSVEKIALQAIRAIPGLSFTGLDFMCKDITQQQTDDSYVIIEVNDSPGFDIHDQPYEGKNRHAAREFLCLMFPELRMN